MGPVCQPPAGGGRPCTQRVLQAPREPGRGLSLLGTRTPRQRDSPSGDCDSRGNAGDGDGGSCDVDCAAHEQGCVRETGEDPEQARTETGTCRTLGTWRRDREGDRAACGQGGPFCRPRSSCPCSEDPAEWEARSQVLLKSPPVTRQPWPAQPPDNGMRRSSFTWGSGGEGLLAFDLHKVCRSWESPAFAADKQLDLIRTLVAKGCSEFEDIWSHPFCPSFLVFYLFPATWAQNRSVWGLGPPCTLRPPPGAPSVRQRWAWHFRVI